MASRIQAYYQKHDDYRRYLMSHSERRRDLARFFSENRRFFGHWILDIACGGGILGFLAEEEGRRYVGIDINPDAISAAQDYAQSHGSGCWFVLGDAREVKMTGSFDTVVLLGNSLCHFNTAEFAEILDNLRKNVRRGSYFIVDYRDVVQILYRRGWAHRFRQTREGRPVVSVTKMLDSVKGELVIDSRSAGGETVGGHPRRLVPFHSRADHGLAGLVPREEAV